MSGRVSAIVRHNIDTFGKLGWYSLALFIAGIGSFFLFGRGPIAAALSSNQGTRDAIGAIAGVIATNVVIALYVKSAFAEDPNSPAPGERQAAQQRPAIQGQQTAAQQGRAKAE